MKILFLITLMLLNGFILSGQEKLNSGDVKMSKIDSLSVQSVLTISKEITINNKTIDWTNFDKVYAYLDSKNEFKQILGVKWHVIDSIDYQMICSSMLCDMELHGTAIVNNPEGDSEIDEDENGGYAVDEFLVETTEYVVSIRIDAESKTKARFIYLPKAEVSEDCDPINDLLMRIVKVQ